MALSDPSWGFEYEDETWFVTIPPNGIMNPEDGSAWKEAGHPPKNKSARKKGQDTFTAYLSLDVKEQRVSHRYSDHTNRWETIEYLKDRLSAHERMGHNTLLIIWDCASWHKAKDLRSFAREHNGRVRRERQGVRLVVTTLPVHAFWMNPVEAIIKHTKAKVLPCRQFDSRSDQQRNIDTFWLHRNLRCACVPKPEHIITLLH